MHFLPCKRWSWFATQNFALQCRIFNQALRPCFTLNFTPPTTTCVSIFSYLAAAASSFFFFINIARPAAYLVLVVGGVSFTFTLSLIDTRWAGGRACTRPCRPAHHLLILCSRTDVLHPRYFLGQRFSGAGTFFVPSPGGRASSRAMHISFFASVSQSAFKMGHQSCRRPPPPSRVL